MDSFSAGSASLHGSLTSGPIIIIIIIGKYVEWSDVSPSASACLSVFVRVLVSQPKCAWSVCLSACICTDHACFWSVNLTAYLHVGVWLSISVCLPACLGVYFCLGACLLLSVYRLMPASVCLHTSPSVCTYSGNILGLCDIRYRIIWWGAV